MINKNKAKLLKAIIYADSPMTFGMLCASFEDEMSRSTIWFNLRRMLIDYLIEEKSFRAEGIDPNDYRMSERKGGRTPKVFYKETDRGEDKLRRLEQEGLI